MAYDRRSTASSRSTWPGLRIDWTVSSPTTRPTSPHRGQAVPPLAPAFAASQLSPEQHELIASSYDAPFTARLAW
jgi:hypothetical protein